MVMEDGGVTHFRLGSFFMYPVPTCCTRITNIFKHARYSSQSYAFINTGREVWPATGEFVVTSDVLSNIKTRFKLIRTRSIFS